MKLESVGILISLQPFDEHNFVARIFTYDFGLMVGMLRSGGGGKCKNRPLVGQFGAVTWNARLDSQLGVFHWEAEKNLAVPVMASATKLSFMNSAFDLVRTLLPERVQYSALYDNTLRLLIDLGTADDICAIYLQWEIAFLRDLGYALDLSRCSGCGATECLNWLSPRTGRAVCDTCAGPYVSKLYKLPLNLGVTMRFLDSVCSQQGVKLPMSRKRIKNL